MPYPISAPGIKKLSELIIDVDKNWEGHSITNLNTLNASSINTSNLSGFTLTGNIIPSSGVSIGDSSHKLTNLYVVNLYTGDIRLMNGWIITERDEKGNIMENGIRILNNKKKEILRITESGIFFKGKEIKI